MEPTDTVMRQTRREAPATTTWLRHTNTSTYEPALAPARLPPHPRPSWQKFCRLTCPQPCVHCKGGIMSCQGSTCLCDRCVCVHVRCEEFFSENREHFPFYCQCVCTSHSTRRSSGMQGLRYLRRHADLISKHTHRSKVCCSSSSERKHCLLT